MSAILYDRALLTKINKWTEKADLHIYGVSDSRHVKEVMADMSNDSNIKLPFITISRDDVYTLNNSNKIPMTFKGIKYYADDTKVISVNAIPITLNYNIDIYTRYLDEADAYIRELIFNIINYPTLQVIIPYLDINLAHNSNIRIANNTILDNSAGERMGYDDITCYRISINVDDAYLWDVRAQASVSIASTGLNVEIHSDDNNKDIVLEPIELE